MSFKKRACWPLAASLGLVLLLASTPAPESTGAVIEVTDDMGRTVKLEKAPQRVVSLAPSNTESLFTIGGGSLLVGVTDFCNYPPEALDLPKVGGFADINLELVVSMDPDLVLADSLHIPEIVPALEGLGIPVAVIIPQSIDGVLASLRLVGTLTGFEEAAAEFAASLENRRDQLTTMVAGQPAPRVFWELSGDLWTAGPGSFVDDLITTAGGSNVAADAGNAWVQLNAEVVIASDPEFIFLADHPYGEDTGTVSSRPGWSELTAVVQGRVIEIVDVDTISRPGPRVMDALAYIARTLHPGVFTDQ